MHGGVEIGALGDRPPLSQHRGGPVGQIGEASDALQLAEALTDPPLALVSSFPGAHEPPVPHGIGGFVVLFT